jgi:hypothetical protein
MSKGKEVGKGGMVKIKRRTNSSTQAMAIQTTASRPIPPCAISDLPSHVTLKYPRISKLKQIYNVEIV